jgi:hypothetical protein
LADGAQQGALFLIAVAGVVCMAIARFAYRVWRLERGLPVPGSRS